MRIAIILGCLLCLAASPGPADTAPAIPGAAAASPAVAGAPAAGPAVASPAVADPAVASPAVASRSVTSYAFSVRGKPALPADFAHFPYVNPAAPKGGSVTLAALGSFDSFNPFILRGTPASGIERVWDTLLRPSADEVLTAYGHVARDIEVAEDRSFTAFDLRPEARFNDGTPITAQDVVWTFNTLRDKGKPFYRLYYADVTDVAAEGPLRVVFHLKPTAAREMPFTLGELPVLPEHWWRGRDFTAPLTDPPLGSGPYQVGHFEFARYVVYNRVPNYWAADLPTGRGLANFGEIHTEYFRDATVAMEAFKAGQIDFRQENVAKNWATAYDFPAVQKGLVKKVEVRHHLPVGMQGFAMNTRRAVFADARVRQAMTWAFDFEWMNKNLFYGAYTRTGSYFANSDLASSGVPAGAELALLEPFRAQLPAELFTTAFALPVTDGSGNNRPQLIHALDLLRQAGWTVQDRKLVDSHGNQMAFTILLDDPIFERVALPYKASLERLGIAVGVRTVDPSQYQEMTDNFDFDMTITVFGESDSPGGEQRDYWSCAAAKAAGSSNITGICNPAVDALVEDVVSAPDYDHLVTATHALDRVLLWGWYVVPNWYLSGYRLAYWDRFGQPEVPVRTGYVFDAWWIDPARAAAVAAAHNSGMP